MASGHTRCVTRAEYEDLALLVAMGRESLQKLETIERHIFSCPSCRDLWAIEELLRNLPGGVWETHLDTLRQEAQRLECATSHGG